MDNTISRHVEIRISRNPILYILLVIGSVFITQELNAQTTLTFSYTTPTVTSDNTGGFVDALTIDVPVSSFPADFVTTDINLVINYDKTAGTCAATETGNSYHNEHGFQLESPVGATQVTIFDPGAFTGADDISPGVTQTFDDASVTAIPGGIPATGTYMPNNSLSSFNFQDPEGTWTLRASETAGGDPMCIISVDIVITAEDLPEPGNVDNTVLWLKANEGVTGTAEVSAWVDQSGNGNNAAQGTTSRRPALVENAFNFNQAITFDGTDDFLDVPYTAQLNGDDMTVISVHRVEQDDNSWRSPFTSRDDFPQRGYIIYVRSDNDQYDLWTGSDSGWDTFQQGLTPGADLQVLGVSFTASTTSNGDKSFYLDGNLQGSTTGTENYDPNTVQPYRVGAGSSELVAGQYFWYGDIAEQIVFNKILSASERERVSSYLAIKYGITLTHDYYNTSYDGTNAGTTILYDVSNGYGNDIAGIGREDLEGLSQPKSKSENDDAVITVSSPTSLDDGDYLVWGNNNLTGTRTTDLPIGYDERLERIWFYDEKGDVGTISIKFELSKLGDRSTDPADYAILINHSSASFGTPDQTTTNGATISDNILTFTNVPIQDGDYLTLAVSAVRGPGGISGGLNLWLKADLITLDVDASTVDLWPDQSGNSNNAEPIPFNRPLIESTLNLNNNPYINYTADNGGQVTLASTSNTSSFIAVLNTSNNGDDIFERNGSTDPMLEVEGGFYRGNSDAGFISTTGIGSWNILELLNSSSSDHKIYVDGMSEDTDATSYTIPASATYNLLSNYTGSIAEVVYYDDFLSDTERRQLESYLAVKYGITLNITTQDYLNGSGASILNRTNFASYANNIAGIGKANANSGNDAQGLNQTASKSINTTAIVEVSNASDFDDGEYLIWGSNNTTALASLAESVPSPTIAAVAMILDRKWRITETGETGTVSVSFDLSSVTSVSGRELAKFSLILDDTEDMSSPISVLKPTSMTSNVVTFTGVDLDEAQFMVLGTDVDAAPGDLAANLVLWLKAGVGVTGTTNASAWADQSDSNENATQGTGGSQPTITANAVNFNQALSFDGGDFLSLGNIMDYTPGTDDWSFFCVFNTNGTGSLLARGGGTTANRQYQYLVTGGNYAQITGGTREDGGITATGAWNMTSALVNGTDDDVDSWLNGTVDINNGAIGTNTETENVIIGARTNGTGFLFTGDISEIIMYDKELSASERESLETYLAIKYGITQSHNYYNTAYDGTNAGSTTIYDVGTYPNDIAGIGRDDEELLNQNQSKSENGDAIITVSSPSSLDSDDYLIWGNDNGASTETTAGVPTGVNDMLTRKWRVEETGDVGTVTIKFDVTGIADVGTTAADFSLIIDMDATFTSGATLVNADDFTASIVTFNNVNLDDGNIFSLATGIDMAVNEISSTVGDYEVTASCPVLSGNSYITLRDASGSIVAEVNPNNNNLGATCWGVSIRASNDNTVEILDEDYFLDRNFYITPTTQPASNVSVRFYVLNAELDDIRTKLTADGKSSGGNVSEYLQDFLRITKTDSNGGSDLDPISTGENTSSLTASATAFGSTGYILEISIGSFSEFSPGTDSDDPNETLPVELVSFKGRSTEYGKNLLEWKTASELNNDYFEIQESSNGVDFERIGQVNGNGTTLAANNYSFIASHSGYGLRYYRLKQVDYDGAFEHSDIINVETVNDFVKWNLYPNPTNGKVWMIVNDESFDAEKAIVEVVDLAGQRFNLLVTKKASGIEIDMYSLKKGMYVITIKSLDAVSTHRVIKR